MVQINIKHESVDHWAIASDNVKTILSARIPLNHELAKVSGCVGEARRIANPYLFFGQFKPVLLHQQLGQHWCQH